MIRWLATIALAVAAVPAAAQDVAPQARFDAAIAASKAVMMDMPRQALARARAAETIAAAISGVRASALAKARAEWLQGEALSRLDQTATALEVLAKALAIVERVAPADALHGDILLSRGWAEESRGGIAAGLADFQNGFRIYRQAGDARGEAKALQNIAGIYQDAGDMVRAERYYSQAAEVYRGDPAFSLAAYNNIGEILRSTGHFAAAEREYGLALAAARQAGSPLLQADVLTNLATAKLLRGDIDGADQLARQAMSLTAKGAADERPFVWGVFARIAFARGDVDEAVRFIDRTFASVDLAHTSLPYREFHKLAADIYARAGRDDLALAHMRAWKRLDDNVRAVAATTNAALMAAQFDFSTQNLRIAQLQANRARLHEMILIVAIVAVSLISALLLSGLVSLRRSRNATRAANRQLMKALEAKDDFLAMTSHEIRTPLNGILGMTQVMLADRALDEGARTRLKVVHSAGETMRLLVDDILELSKMETEALALERGPVRLRALIDEAADLWRGKAESKGLSLALELDGCPELIEEDGDRLRQILFNLLSNAVKFTDAGGVTLSAAALGDRLVIRVTDTGIGIAPEHHALIFEKFRQADASTSRRFGGTGLGLAICHNLADAMGGGITVKSALDQGATFTLDLPLRLLAVPEPEVFANDAPRATIVFDPNALTRRILGKAVASDGREIQLAASSDDLIALLRSTSGSSVVAPLAALVEHSGPILAALRDGDARLLLIAAPEEDVAALTQNPRVAVLRKPVAAAELQRALEAPQPEAIEAAA